MIKIKTAVVGAGYLGKFHIEKHASLEQSELVAICDTNTEQLNQFSKHYNCLGVTDYKDLVGKVDAVCIATPTSSHFEIGSFFLKNGVHVFMEKPISTTIDEADKLIALADKNNLKLQVGHLERFNPAIKEILPHTHAPRFIESVRLAPFNARGTDVNVVLDIMIHDIDLIYFIVRSPIVDIRANGASVFSDTADIVNVRIEFENGCVANVTASRMSLKVERKMRIFGRHNYISANLQDPEVIIYSHENNLNLPLSLANVEHQVIKLEKSDAILEETECFLNAIINDTTPPVTGQDGKQALDIAIKITQALHQSKQWNLDYEAS